MITETLRLVEGLAQIKPLGEVTVSEPGKAQEGYAECYALSLELYPVLSRIAR